VQFGDDGPVVFSTYLGGARGAGARDVAVDRQGYVYVTGGTESDDFPVTPGAYQTKSNPGIPESSRVRPSDVFVTKFSPSGAIVWSTLIGGPNHDRAYAIAVDADEYVYVAGRAGRGFPVTPGAVQTSFMGGQGADFYGEQDGFVCKLKPDGTALVFCSYFGTSDPNIVRDLAVDQHGDIYIASAYSSGAFPASIASAFSNRPHGGRDGVVAKLKGDGSRVLWATYLGGSGEEGGGNSIRLDAAGNPYALITTASSDAETTPGAYQRAYGGDEDLYVARLTPDRGTLVWATYLGGPQNESTETHELAVDAQGNVYIAAPTKSPSFPTTPGAFQRQFGGVHDIFVAKLSPDGSRLLASTFIGGDGPDRPEGVAVDAFGNVHFTGVTASTNFPLTEGAVQSRHRGERRREERDAVAVVLAADFSRLLFSTLVGGDGDQSGRGATVDSQGNFYIVGETNARNWPLKNAARAASSGRGDAFVMKFTFPRR
jgi:Beta-propeller repeat